MRTYKRNVPDINTSSDLNKSNKYLTQLNFKGIKEEENIYSIDQESLSDALNVYVDEENHLVSRPSLQNDLSTKDLPYVISAQIYGQHYSLIEVLDAGKYTVYVLETYRIVGTNNLTSIYNIYILPKGYDKTELPDNSRLKNLADYHISIVDNYIICFNKDAFIEDSSGIKNKVPHGARVFDINNAIEGWQDFNKFVDIPVVKRTVGNQVTTYEKNQFTNYTKEEYIWSNNSMPILPSGKPDIKVISNNGTNYWKVQSNDKDLSVNTDYRLMTNLPVTILKGDIVTMAQNVVCIARTSYFLLSFNNGQSFTQYYYPSYLGKFLYIASISEDAKYFLFVATDGVYECNIVDVGATPAFTWKVYYLDGDENNKIGDNLNEYIAYNEYSNCVSYPTKNNFTFMFNLGNMNIVGPTGDYSYNCDKYIYYCGKSLPKNYAAKDTELILHRTNIPSEKFGPFDSIELSHCLNMTLDTDGIPLITFIANYNAPLISISKTDYDALTPDKNNYGNIYKITNDGINIKGFGYIKKSIYSGLYYKANLLLTTPLTTKFTWVTAIRGGVYDATISSTEQHKVSPYHWDSIIEAIAYNNLVPEEDVNNYTGIIALKSISQSITSEALYPDAKTELLFTVKVEAFLRYGSDETNTTQTDFWRIGTIYIPCPNHDAITGIAYSSQYAITDITTFNDPILNVRARKGEPYKLSGGYLVYLPDFPNTLCSYSFISKQWAKNLLRLKSKNSTETIPFSFGSYYNKVNIVGDKFYLFNIDSATQWSIYTNAFTDTDSAILDYLIEPQSDEDKLFRKEFHCSHNAGELFLANNNEFYITANTRNEDGKLLLNLPVINNKKFIDDVTAITNISTTEIAIFFTNGIKICAKVSDDTYGYRYDYYNTKLSTGVGKYDSVINTIEGTYTLFPTKRGLAAMNYQAFMATTDQALTYITDDIHNIWTEFYNYKVDEKIGGLYAITRFIKIVQWRQYLILTNGSKQMLIYDLIRHYWWKWEVPENLRIALTDQEDLKVISIFNLGEVAERIGQSNLIFGDQESYGRLLVFTNKWDGQDLIYRDFSGLKTIKGIVGFIGRTNVPIDWRVVSQPLHFNAPTYYKNIKQLIFQLYSEKEETSNSTIIAQIQVFRKKLDVRAPETIGFKIDKLRTFVKRFNYWKICELQWALSADIRYSLQKCEYEAYPKKNEVLYPIDTTDNPQPLRLNGININYEIGGEVR